MARSIIDLDQTPAMEKIDECAELQTPFGRPPLRSMLSEPAGSIDDHNDLLCSHCRQNFRHFTGHEFYSVSYVSQFDREPLVMLNFALSPTSQTPPFDRAGFDGHFSPLVRMNSMKSSLTARGYGSSSAMGKNTGGSLTPDRRRSSGAGNVREQLATNQGSVFYSSPRSAASFIGLAMSAVSSTFSNQMQSPGIPPVAAIAPQTAAQAPMATKHRLKAILTVDSKTTEILIANDNVKRVFGLLHYTLIGKRLTEVFSASADEKLPAIPYNELFAQDGKLRAVYGKAVDIVDAAGNRGTVCVWSYPLTHAAAAASERIVSGKQQMLVRAPSAILSPTRRIGDTLNYRAGNITTPSHRCGAHCACLFLPVAQSSQSQYCCPQGGPQVILPYYRSISIQCTTPPTASQLTTAGRCSRAEKVRHGLDKMVEGGSSPLRDSVINGYRSERPNSEMDEKEVEEGDESRSSVSQRERGHITNGAAARRWLILMEPINALSIACTLGAKGRIFRVDDSLATLLGYVSMSELLGTEIGKLIPAVNLDADDEEQHVCALGIRGNSIPITVRIAAERDPKTKNALMYELQIRALSAVNGVVTLTESGNVHSFNENFIEALVGKQCKEQALHSLIHITDIIPQFHTHIHTCEATSASEESAHDDMSGSSSGNQTPPFEECDNWPTSISPKKPLSSSSSSTQLADRIECLSVQDTDDQARLTYLTRSEQDICSAQPSISQCSGYHKRTKAKGDTGEGDDGEEEVSPCRVIREGTFYGLARHSDAHMIAVRFDVRRLETGCPANWAVCIGYDRSADFGLFGNTSRDIRQDDSTADLLNSPEDDDYSRNEINIKRSESSALACVSLQALEDENAEAVCGEYSQHYDTFQLIGNGAFGSVKLAARKDTGLLAVTKFICKSKVLPEGWVPSPKRGNRMVPIELHLLETLSHPNIVKVLDVYENETYYQLVMEKLGCGMDLFEFIDHQPKLDEPLMSYIFRQIVSAVAYLHANNIVHRDVKDENVIIDQNFCCKLIDFGSAAYFGQDIVFSTFCGTMEYCSPEVLSGNKYLGPELEMWSLGILLYTLVYFENPFRGPQETVQAEIELPWEVSDGLFQVIAWLLQRDPRLRATVDEIKSHWWITQPVDMRKYKFQDMLKTCERAQIDPPLYVCELANHLKNASSCSALVIDVPTSHQETNTVTAR